MADNLDAIGRLDNLTGLGALTVAALFNRQIDNHRTRLHIINHRLGDQGRGRTARDQGGTDGNIGLLQRFMDLLGLTLLEVLARFLGVTASGFHILHAVDHQEAGTKALHLLLCRHANVRSGNDSAQTARGGDRLQTGNTGTHDQNAGRGNGARSGHHHRERTAIFGCGIKHGLVTGEV